MLRAPRSSARRHRPPPVKRFNQVLKSNKVWPEIYQFQHTDFIIAKEMELSFWKGHHLSGNEERIAIRHPG